MTGEILKTLQVKRKVKPSEMFVKIHKHALADLFICTGGELILLMAMIPLLEYRTNFVYLDTHTRQDISKQSGLSLNSIKAFIPNLCSKQVLYKMSSTKFLLNPKYFYFGKESDRKTLLKLIESI